MSDTKQFVHVREVRDGVLVLKDGGLRAIILVSSMNFELKSEVEKQGIVDAYQGFLNSLDYPLEILVNSRQINLDDYMLDLKSSYEKQENELLKLQIGEYMNFVNGLIEISNAVSKNFYVVVSYATSEKTSALLSGKTISSNYSDKQLEEFATQLWQRVKQVRVGIIGLGLHAEILNTKEAIELLYNFYNPEVKTKKVGALYKGAEKRE